MNRKKQIILVVIVLLVNFLLDRVTKMLAVNYLQGKETLSYFYDTIVLHYTENTGAFLSLGAGWPDWLKYILLLAIPIVLCLYGLYYCAFKLTDKRLVIAFVTVIGGGLGNLVDRLIYDFHVVDFLNFGIGSLRTGILNVADMSVTFAVIYLLIMQFKADKKLPD
ncbi:MAG: signal peptidase II [Paludibacter sp.]|jgi:signal peptidase II